MKKIKISVKQSHIDKGYQDSGEFCPIARAIKDILKDEVINGLKVFVKKCTVTFTDKYNTYTQKRRLPDVAKNFIHEFDRADLAQTGDAFEPFEFQINSI